jgi:hypothetical protein
VAQFPRGSLSPEAIVLRAQVLLASGDRAGAKTLAHRYSAAHPDGPYGKRLGSSFEKSAECPLSTSFEGFGPRDVDLSCRRSVSTVDVSPMAGA